VTNSVNEGTVDVPATPLRSRRRRAIIVGVGVCVVVAATGVAIAATSSKSSSAGAAVIVRRALASTLATNSLAFSLGESVSAGSTTIAVSGQGECDLSNALCGVTMHYSGPLSTAGSIQVIYAGGTAYVNLGSALPELGLTPWISVPVTNSSSASLGVSESPLTGLSLLAAQGATVTNDGTVSEDGQRMTQYTVTVDGAQVQNLITSGAVKLPSWMAAAVSKFSSGTATETVDVDSAGRLGYLSAKVNETISGTVAGVMFAETVTGYGVPVNVAVPPASQVTSITNLSQLANL
jgi:predicted lipoprotein with Yx(FWY)xxD motif